MKISKRESIKRIIDTAVIATVDIGKVTNYGYCRSPKGTEMKPFPFPNDAKGYSELMRRITEFRAQNKLSGVIVGYESTGTYAEPLVHFLKDKEVKLVQVNPMHTKKAKELEDNSPLKSDKKDPKIIANLIEMGHYLSVVVPEGSAAELRKLNNARERTIRRRTIMYNQVQDLVYEIFPEFLQIMKGVKSVTAQYLLKNITTPENIVNTAIEELTKIIKKISRGKLGVDRAKALYEVSKNSVGIIEGQKSIVMEIKEIMKTIETSNQFIEEIEKKMSEYLEKIPYSKYILSMKGMGKVTASGLIGEVADFRKFRTIDEIMKFAGLDLYEISSGQHNGICRISKRGRALLRKTLYFAALNTVRKGGVMHEWYTQYVEKGNAKNKGLIAVARKLLRIIFALVRDEKEFINKEIKEVA